jgi:phosphoenolpyruvate carboxylase
MFSQHPDNAGAPYWHDAPMVRTHHEPVEAVTLFRDLGGEEFMWDFEGKLVDEGVIERLLGEHYEFFSEQPLGRDRFLTFRIPNPRLERGLRPARAFMVILSAEDLARAAGLHEPPLFEVVLPMTTSAEDILRIQTGFRNIAQATHHSFDFKDSNLHTVEVIPIFEEVRTILDSPATLERYLEMYRAEFGANPEYLRPFCARSDPALNSGIVPTVLAIRSALAAYTDVAARTGVPMYPILAPGALPFRGGLTPANVEQFADQYAGVRTMVIQSAFRYDFPLEDVKQAIRWFQENLAKREPAPVSLRDREQIEQVVPLFEQPYRASIEGLAKLINAAAAFVPPRRERMQHIGLFGYSRGVGQVTLPRAITFTAACYSLGVPPELIGTGRGLAAAREHGSLALIDRLFPTMPAALERSGRFLRRESLEQLGLTEIAEDIRLLESHLGTTLRPQTAEEAEHVELSGKIVAQLLAGGEPRAEVQRAAELRRSIG